MHRDAKTDLATVPFSERDGDSFAGLQVFAQPIGYNVLVNRNQRFVEHDIGHAKISLFQFREEIFRGIGFGEIEKLLLRSAHAERSSMMSGIIIRRFQILRRNDYDSKRIKK